MNPSSSISRRTQVLVTAICLLAAAYAQAKNRPPAASEQQLFIGEGIAEADHRIRPRPGIPPAQHLLLPWHSLRRRHRRQKPLHAAATAARMAGNPACGSFRGLITSTLLRPAARILLDVCRPLELRPDGRRLPAAQHLDARALPTANAVRYWYGSTAGVSRRVTASNRTATTGRISPATATLCSAR